MKKIIAALTLETLIACSTLPNDGDVNMEIQRARQVYASVDIIDKIHNLQEKIENDPRITLNSREKLCGLLEFASSSRYDVDDDKDLDFKKNPGSNEEMRNLYHSTGIIRIKGKKKDGSLKELVGTTIMITQGGYFLTAHHVVDFTEIKKAEITMPNGKKYTLSSIENVYSNTFTDQAIFKVEMPYYNPLFFREDRGFGLLDPERLQNDLDIRLLGYRYGLLVEAVGYIDKKDKSFYKTTAVVMKGNSGGPVISETGQLAGIIIEGNGIKYSTRGHMNFSGSDDIQRLLFGAAREEYHRYDKE